MNHAGIKLPRRDSEITDFLKILTPVQEKLLISLAIQYKMHIPQPIFGNINCLTLDQRYNNLEAAKNFRSVSNMTGLNATFLSGGNHEIKINSALSKFTPMGTRHDPPLSIRIATMEVSTLFSIIINFYVF